MTNERQRSPGGKFDHIEVDYLSGLAERITAGDYIGGPELADRLRNHGSRPISDTVLNYLCRYLEGDVDKPKGRRPSPEFERRLRDRTIGGLYRHYLDCLEERKRRYGHPAGWTKLDYSPGEMAARLVARYYHYGVESWRTVQNIASRK